MNKAIENTKQILINRQHIDKALDQQVKYQLQNDEMMSNLIGLIRDMTATIDQQNKQLKMMHEKCKTLETEMADIYHEMDCLELATTKADSKSFH